MNAARAKSLALLLAASSACAASSLPTPPYAKQPTSALAPVPYPPPPARVESVPSRPSTKATWIDGEWTWRNKRWLWVRGRWVEPPKGGRYSPWVLVRAADGTLYAAAGTWRDGAGNEIKPPRPLAEATVSEAGVVDVLGDHVAPGPTLPTPGAPEETKTNGAKQ